MFMHRIFFFCIVFNIPYFASNMFAQHKDCGTALELCGSSPFYITPGSGTGIPDPDVNSSCLLQEFNSMWVKWTVLESGLLTFVLTPDSALQDIDFIVFHAQSDYDCQHKVIV
jgi:hypothetical protein